MSEIAATYSYSYITIDGIEGYSVGCSNKTEATYADIPNTYNDGTHGELPVIDLAYGMFEGLSSAPLPLARVSLPDTLISIKGRAFSYCPSLEEIIIPNSVKYINDGAFWYCSNVAKLVVGSGVQTIGNNAFVFHGLLEAYLLPTTPPTAGSNILAYSSNVKAYCYEQSEQAYKTATNWSSVAGKIYGNNIQLYLGSGIYADDELATDFILNAKYIKEYIADKYALTFDSTPTAGSTNPVTSEGIKTAIDNLATNVYAKSGTVTILTSDWSSNIATKTFVDLEQYDIIQFYPASINDKTNSTKSDIFVSASGTTVTFTANTTPSENITFNYCIIRGIN